jgi:ribosomal protein L29
MEMQNAKCRMQNYLKAEVRRMKAEAIEQEFSEQKAELLEGRDQYKVHTVHSVHAVHTVHTVHGS